MTGNPSRRRPASPARRFVVALLVLVALAGAAACGSTRTEAGGDGAAATVPSSLVEPVTVVVIGSSTASGVGAVNPAQAWVERIERGLVRMSTVTRLQIGYSFRNGPQARSESGAPPLALMPLEYLTPAAEDRAVGVQLQLADRGLHRAPAIPDLLVAAVAEMAGLTVLALDRDFDLIAQVTGQAVEWLRL